MWVKKFIFQLFFKNETVNQKSETVKLLGYEWTCFPDSGGLRKLILSLPRPYSEPLENLLFLAFSGVSKQKWPLEAKKSIFKKLLKINSYVQNCILDTSGVPQNGFRPISDLDNDIRSIFRKSKILHFFKFFPSLFSVF